MKALYIIPHLANDTPVLSFPMFLKTNALLFIASVSGALGSAMVGNLKGKYCGSIAIYRGVSLSSVLEFHDDEYLMNAHFVFADSVYAFDKGEGYALDASDKIVLQTDNEAYNAYLASFPLGLTTASFDTTYNRASDSLTCKINIAFFMNPTVELTRANCRTEMKNGLYQSENGLVKMLVNTADSSLHVTPAGEMAAIVTDAGNLDYELAADGKLRLSREGSPVVTYRMEQVPGEDAVTLLYTSGDMPKGIVLLLAGSASAAAGDKI